MTPAPSSPVPAVEVAGIYIASKAIHGPRWREWRGAGHPIISTWIDEAEQGRTTDWPNLWERCVSEAARAAVTIVYREPGEELKGARVEVGAALAHGRKVLVVGDVQDSWTKHSNVTRVETMNIALSYAALTLTPGRAAEPDTMVTGDEAEALATVHQLIAMGDNRTFRASTVLALMNERSAQRTRAETAEAQLSDAQERISDLEYALKNIAQHHPKTPGLSWDYDLQLAESAADIAKRALLSTPGADR